MRGAGSRGPIGRRRSNARRHLAACCFSLGFVGAWVPAVSAQPLTAERDAVEAPRLRLELDPLTDGVVSAVAVASLGGLLLEQQRHRGPNEFHAYDGGADVASDFTGGAIGAAFVGVTAAALEGVEQGRVLDGVPTAVVAAQAAVLAVGVTQTLKRLTGHCRPLAVTPQGRCSAAQVPDDFQPGDDRTHAAFPSGHVASVAAVSGALGGVLFKNWLLDGRGSTLRWAAFGLGTAATATTVVLRREAGAHSLLDGLAAAGIGGALGFGVAVVHPMVPVTASDAGVASLDLAWSGTGFTFSGTF